jgi:hypothetical protein
MPGRLYTPRPILMGGVRSNSIARLVAVRHAPCAGREHHLLPPKDDPAAEPNEGFSHVM